MCIVKLRRVPSLRTIKNHVELLLYDKLVVDASQIAVIRQVAQRSGLVAQLRELGGWRINGHRFSKNFLL